MQAEKDYGSCEAQRDKILSYVKSQEDLEVVQEYSDPGFTGSNLDRPALKALLGDIGRGQIKVVLTYKIDRLTRSSKDFYSLIEFFEQHGVTYVSVTEHFDTSSPSGRLLRNIMLTFAQFEREMNSERVKDKMEQNAKKGYCNGSIPSFGYKRINKKLVVDKKNARLVKELFEKFVETGHFTDVLRLARQRGIKNPKKNTPMTESRLYYLLRNPLYIGKVKWHDQLFDGLHEPIISKDLFVEAQGLTKGKLRKRRLYKEYILTRLIKCSECKSSMTNVFTNKKKRRYYYYKCIKVTKEGKHACSIKEVNAEKLESFIFENLERISQDKNYVESLVFKMLRNKPHSAGNELPSESDKNYTSKVLHVLKRYASDYKNASQVEKILVTKRTIEKIYFSKRSVEVIVSLEDRT